MKKVFFIFILFISFESFCQISGEEYVEKGFLSYGKLQYIEAIAFLDEAVKINDNDIEAYLLRSLCYFK